MGRHPGESDADYYDRLIAEAEADHHAGRKMTNPQGWKDRERALQGLRDTREWIRRRDEGK